jgi:hypothetical protein
LLLDISTVFSQPMTDNQNQAVTIRADAIRRGEVGVVQ